jgi:hypothetical protein
VCECFRHFVATVFHLDTVSGGDGVKPVDEDTAALALADPDERLPRKAAESGGLSVLSNQGSMLGILLIFSSKNGDSDSKLSSDNTRRSF